MSKLTDAIKQDEIATALDLIRSTSYSASMYRKWFYLAYGDLLEAQENITNRVSNFIEDLKLNHNGAEYDYYAKYEFAENYGRVPMQLAAERGQLEVVNALLDAGVPPEGPWVRKCKRFQSVGFIAPEVLASPLHLAVANGHDAVAQRLIDAGANVKAFVPVEFSCFDMPQQTFWPQGTSNVTGCIGKHGASVLYFAAARCNLDTIRKLIVERQADLAPVVILQGDCVDIEYPTSYRYEVPTALMHAIVKRPDTDTDVIAGLLQFSRHLFRHEEHTELDVNRYIRRRALDQQDNVLYIHCHTALSLAIKHNKLNFARLLLQHGATLWPKRLADVHHVAPDIRWFDVKPDVIATAQQLATILGIRLEGPPENFPDANGNFVTRMQGVIVPTLPDSAFNMPLLFSINAQHNNTALQVAEAIEVPFARVVLQ